jgi:hypothetical protein
MAKTGSKRPPSLTRNTIPKWNIFLVDGVGVGLGGLIHELRKYLKMIPGFPHTPEIIYKVTLETELLKSDSFATLETRSSRLYYANMRPVERKRIRKTYNTVSLQM